MYYKKIILIALFISYHNVSFVFSQEKCKVLREDIAGIYIGKCKKGLASGQGVSKGKNKYVGNFRKGLPDGVGVITYSDGSVYSGKFKKGLKHGKGKYILKNNGKDSVIEGLWKKGKFYKKIRKRGYKVTKKSSPFVYRIQKVNNTQNRVTIKVFVNGIPYKIPGNVRSSGGVQFNRLNTTGFESIIKYPFTCELSYNAPTKSGGSTHLVEFNFEILEPGDWEVVIRH